MEEPFSGHIFEKDSQGDWEYYNETKEKDSFADAVIDSISIYNNDKLSTSEESYLLYIKDLSKKEENE